MTSSERIHLAQELHDGIAQELVAVGYGLDLLLGAAQTPVQTRVELRTLRFAITELIEKVRLEIYELRNSDPTSLVWNLEKMSKAICDGLVVDLHLEEAHLSPLENHQVLKIARELLRNVISHSQATRVYLHLETRSDMTTLQIFDNGIGGAQSAHHRFGIVGATERALNIGAILNWTTGAQGTRATLEIPRSSQQRDG